MLLYFIVEVSLFIERTDYRSNVAKTILFENCSCFSKIPFSISNLPGYFRVSFRFPQVTEFGKSTANRRQIFGDLLGRFFLSKLLSLVICTPYRSSCHSMTGRSDRSARALRDGADVVRGAKGNQFLRANLLYVPNINM